jgi:hypothetical protein
LVSISDTTLVECTLTMPGASFGARRTILLVIGVEVLVAGSKRIAPGRISATTEALLPERLYLP